MSKRVPRRIRFERMTDLTQKPPERAVRVKFDAEQEGELQSVLGNKRDGDPNLTASGLLLTWLYEVGAGEEKIKEWKVLRREGKVTFTKGRQGGPSVNYTVRVEELPDLPDGSSDGTEGYLLPLSDELYPYLRGQARLDLAKAKVQEITLEVYDLQGYAQRLLRAKLTDEATALAKKRLDDAKTAQLERMKSAKKAAEDDAKALRDAEEAAKKLAEDKKA